MTNTRIVDTTPRPPVTLAHFVVRCQKYAETLAWYQSVLVAQTAFANDFIAFLSYDNEHHRVALLNMGANAPAKSTGAGVDHIAFGLANVTALINHYCRLKELGVTPSWCVHHGGTLSMYYDDPEGVRCEFQVEVFATPEEFTAYMGQPAFESNPIGVEYDPETILQRYLAGESDEQLLDQTRL